MIAVKNKSMVCVVSIVVIIAFLFGGYEVAGSNSSSVDLYADRVIWAYTPYTYCDQMNPLDALGPSDVMPFDICGYPGLVILEFTDVCLVDGPGDDLVVYEVSGSNTLEVAQVHISADNTTYVDLGEANTTAGGDKLGISYFDIGAPGVFRFVMIEDLMGLSEVPPYEKYSGGFDVDSVEALHSVPCPKETGAEVDCDPDTLNLDSKGRWITCYIEFAPQERWAYMVEQADWKHFILPIGTPQTSKIFYDWHSAGSHTGYEEPYESKLYLHQNTLTGDLSLIMHHNIQRKTSGIETGYGRVDFDLEGIPPGAFVSQSDDERDRWDPPRIWEFSLSYPDMEGHWEYVHNTDGGALDGLPLDEEWSITIHPLYWESMDGWEVLSGEGVSYELDMDLPVTISYEYVTFVNEIDASTILLNDAIPPELDEKYGFVKDPDSYIMDHDGDGILERMIKFYRSSVEDILSPGDPVLLTITGRLYDGTGFECSDEIRVIG